MQLKSLDLDTTELYMRLDRFIESKLAYSAQTVRDLFVQRKVILNGVAVSEGRGRITEFCQVEVVGSILQARPHH